MSKRIHFNWKIDIESKRWDEACKRILKAKDYTRILSTSDFELKRSIDRLEFLPQEKQEQIMSSIEEVTKSISEPLTLKSEKTYLDEAYKLMNNPQFRSEWDSIKKKFSIPVEAICNEDGTVIDLTCLENFCKPYPEEAKRKIMIFCYKWGIEGMSGWVPYIPTTQIEVITKFLCFSCRKILSSPLEPCCDTPKRVRQQKLYIRVTKHTTAEDFRNLSDEWLWYQKTFLGKQKLPSLSERDREFVKLSKKFRKEGVEPSKIPSKIVEYTLEHHPDYFRKPLWKDDIEKNWRGYAGFLEDPNRKKEFEEFMENYTNKRVKIKGKKGKIIKKYIKLGDRILIFRDKFPPVYKEMVKYHKKNPVDLIPLVEKVLYRHRKE